MVDERRTRRVLLVTPGNPMVEPALATEAAVKLAQVEKSPPSVLATPAFKRKAEDRRLTT